MAPQMSVGKATASSALTFSVGTKSWMSAAGVGAGAGVAVAAGAAGACGGRGSPAAAAALPAASASSMDRVRPFIVPPLSLRIARNAEADVRPRVLAGVAEAQPQLRDGPMQEARATDHMVLALGGADRVANELALEARRERVEVVRPLGHVVAQVEEAERVRREAVD